MARPPKVMPHQKKAAKFISDCLGTKPTANDRKKKGRIYRWADYAMPKNILEDIVNRIHVINDWLEENNYNKLLRGIWWDRWTMWKGGRGMDKKGVIIYIPF